MQSRTLGGTPAALAGDDLIILAMRADDDWLDQPARRDRGGQFVERGFLEMAARLIGVRRHRTHGQHPYATNRRLVPRPDRRLTRHIAKQCSQATPQTGTRTFGRRLRAHAAAAPGWVVSGRRAISSRASAI